MRARQAHGLGSVPDEDFELTALNDRELILTDLITFGQVGVEIILARENTARIDGAAYREPEAHSPHDRLSIRDRQNTWQRDVHRGRLRVRRGAKRGRGTRKYL